MTDTGTIDVQKQVVVIDGEPVLTGGRVKFKGDLRVEVETHTDLDLLVRGDARAFTTAGNMTLTAAEGEIVVD